MEPRMPGTEGTEGPEAIAIGLGTMSMTNVYYASIQPGGVDTIRRARSALLVKQP